MNSIEIKEKVLNKGEICDPCLGRQVTLKYQGISNGTIGAALRNSESEEEINKRIEEKPSPEIKENCFICQGLLSKLSEMQSKLFEEAEKIEFENFLIGTKIPGEIAEKEELIWTEIPPENTEPIKRQINRETGKKLEAKTGKKTEFEDPEVTFILNFEEDKIEKQIKSIYFYGKYNKLERGIPQTKWPCSECKGKGCEECNGTGQQFPYTVEGITAKPLLEETKAEESKFHGQGREDRDALMIGNGRPFIIEAVNPIKRNINVKKLQEKINKNAEGKIKVKDMRYSDKEEVVSLKSRRSDKIYEIWVKSRAEINEEDMKKLEEVFTEKEIEQRTPTRVNHRRTDKIRKREVIKVKAEKIDKNMFKARIKAEAGTYIKELVSGDYGRTRPSFAEIIKNKLTPDKLNVVNIDEPSDN